MTKNTAAFQQALDQDRKRADLGRLARLAGKIPACYFSIPRVVVRVAMGPPLLLKPLGVSDF